MHRYHANCINRYQNRLLASHAELGASHERKTHSIMPVPVLTNAVASSIDASELLSQFGCSLSQFHIFLHQLSYGWPVIC
eukprot:m.66983 g.66983  ORF g.66983 m.66983 type:complete len:80 (-) comp12154_c1_seq1:1655-1894(-)